MKKIMRTVLVLALALSLTACGKEQSATFTMEQEENGFKMTDTMVLEAKGDKVHTMKEDIVFDLSSLDEETQTVISETYDQMVELYTAVEGVECVGTAGEGSYTLSITIDATGDAITQLAEQGLLQVTGNSDGISLKATTEALTAGGYTLAE